MLLVQNGTLYIPGSRMEKGKEKKRGKGKAGGGEEEKEPSRHEPSVKEGSQKLSSTLPPRSLWPELTAQLPQAPGRLVKDGLALGFHLCS